MPKFLPLIKNNPELLQSLDKDTIPLLAQEIRSVIIEHVAEKGGHLAPNLGVVDLSIAIHRAFNFPKDALLFDIGHQCYPHKLLTGRYDSFSSLRSLGGISGFPSPHESPYDIFSVGHAGTAISTAIGMALESQKTGTYNRIVGLIGDAAIVNGVALEGLNGAEGIDRQLLVILNDNGMSISSPQGSLSKVFKKLIPLSLPNPPPSLPQLFEISRKHSIACCGAPPLFEYFGWSYIGPLDGHDIDALEYVLNMVRDIKNPIILHVKTIKGYGLQQATNDPIAFHSPSPFIIEDQETTSTKKMTTEVLPKKKTGKSFTKAYADAMINIVKDHPHIKLITAGMLDGTGLSDVKKVYPHNVFDTGICESHAMDMSAGIAKAGGIPFFSVYSTFLQRAFDQVFQEVALQNLPVRLCIDRAGLVGEDGTVHQGFMDIGFLRLLPGITLIAAIDETSLGAALDFMAKYHDGPSAVRYPRANVPPQQQSCPPFKHGKAHQVFKPKDEPVLAILGYGPPTVNAIDVAKMMESENIPISVYDLRFAKPIDHELIATLATEKCIPLITIEDHAVKGGIGSIVIETINNLKLSHRSLVYPLGIPDKWIPHGKRIEQIELAGIGHKTIEQTVRKIISEHKENRR